MVDPEAVLEHLRTLDRTQGERAALEAALDELCVAESPVVVELAQQLFQRLVERDRRAARTWLGQLPLFRRPKSFDLTPWQTALRVPTDRIEFVRGEMLAREARIAEMLGTIEGDTRAPRGLGLVFDIEVPVDLASAWQERREVRRGVRFIENVRGVVADAIYIASDEPRSCLPFAHIDEDVLFLDRELAIMRFTKRQIRPVAKSAAAWLRKRARQS